MTLRGAVRGMKEVLGVEELWRIYPMGDSQVKALRGVSLSIFEGEMVAITGPSGRKDHSIVFYSIPTIEVVFDLEVLI